MDGQGCGSGQACTVREAACIERGRSGCQAGGRPQPWTRRCRSVYIPAPSTNSQSAGIRQEWFAGDLEIDPRFLQFCPHPRGDVRLDYGMGGGSIWDVGCYPISYTRTVAGKAPLEVFGWQVASPTGIDETFVGQMRFDHEVQALFDCSFVIPFQAFSGVMHWRSGGHG
jgi:hypothetical protein